MGVNHSRSYKYLYKPMIANNRPLSDYIKILVVSLICFGYGPHLYKWIRLEKRIRGVCYYTPAGAVLAPFKPI